MPNRSVEPRVQPALSELPQATTFGGLLKFLRRRAQLSQRELSLAVGYSEAQISRLELNKRLPDMTALAALFVPALRLQDEPRVAQRLMALAAAARGETQPPDLLTPPLAPPVPATAASPEASPVVSLPQPLTPFIGRVRELAEVTRLLAGARCLTLTGAGGCGKTRLALQSASDMAARYPQGVVVVELAALADPELVLQAVAQALGLRDVQGQSLLKALLGYLRPRETLLLLDNCEHLLLACAQLVETLLRECPGLRVLATSREPLSIAAETTWPVPGMAVPDPSAGDLLDPAAGYDAVRLFVERAQAALPAAEFSEPSAAAVGELCRRLDGIPLAIELAAPLVRVLSVEQITARLDDRFRLLTTGSRTALPRHQTLRATMDWSHELLPPEERLFFRRLAVFAGGWTLEAAEQVCAEPDMTAGSTVTLLYRLVAKSLVVSDLGGQAARYRLLETVRQYVQAQLLASGELDKVRGRHFDVYLRLAEEANMHFRHPEETEWVPRLDVEQDNIRAALAWALAPGAPAPRDAALRLCAQLGSYWEMGGHHVEAHAWFERALVQAGAQPSALRARGLYHLAVLTPMSYSGEKARPLVEQALAMAREVGDQGLEADALFYLAVRAEGVGDRDRAESLYARALALFETLGDLRGQAGILGSKAQADLFRGNLARSEGMYRRALSLYRQADTPYGITWITGNLAYLALLRGDFERGALLIQETEQIARANGNLYWIAYAGWTLAEIAFRQADYPRALALLDEFIARAQQITDTAGALRVRHWQGQIACYQGHYARALALQEEALAELQRLHPDTDSMLLQNIQALTHLYQGDLARARDLSEPGIAFYRKRAEPQNLALALYHRGSVAYHQGQLAQAGDMLSEALALIRACGVVRILAMTLQALGRLALARDDLAGAADYFHESLALRRRTGARRGIAETLEGFGALAARQTQPVRAAQLLGAADALRAAIGAPVPTVEQAERRRVLAQARRQLDDHRFAAAWAAGQALTVDEAMDLAVDEHQADIIK